MSDTSKRWLKSLNRLVLLLEGVPVWRLVDSKYIVECARRQIHKSQTLYFGGLR